MREAWTHLPEPRAPPDLSLSSQAETGCGLTRSIVCPLGWEPSRGCGSRELLGLRARPPVCPRGWPMGRLHSWFSFLEKYQQLIILRSNVWKVKCDFLE